MNDETVNPGPEQDRNTLPPRGGAGWQRTNSHPAKRNFKVSNEGIVLGSGFDSLYLSLSLRWNDRRFFDLIDHAKEQAQKNEVPMPAVIKPQGGGEWIFNVYPTGAEGYSWRFSNTDFHVKLTSAMVPSARPNALVELRAEALWRQGPLQAVCSVIEFFEAVGALVYTPKVSRVDPCLDILIPIRHWKANLQNHAVTRAVYKGTHSSHRDLTGLTIGRGKLMARIYDKVEEIETKSKKTWMYQIWKLEELPAKGLVVRVEFQLRREILRELAIDTVWELFDHPGHLWRYLTHQWLKFQEDVSKDHRVQKTLPWWRTVQKGFWGLQPEHGLVRSEAINIDKRKIAQQLFGQMTSLVAIDDDTGDVSEDRQITLDQHIVKVREAAELLKLDPKQLGERVTRKIARFVRRVQKMKEAEMERKELGLPQQIRHPSERHTYEGGII